MNTTNHLIIVLKQLNTIGNRIFVGQEGKLVCPVDFGIISVLCLYTAGNNDTCFKTNIEFHQFFSRFNAFSVGVGNYQYKVECGCACRFFLFNFFFNFCQKHPIITSDVIICTGYTIFANTLNL